MASTSSLDPSKSEIASSSRAHCCQKERSRYHPVATLEMVVNQHSCSRFLKDGLPVVLSGVEVAVGSSKSRPLLPWQSYCRLAFVLQIAPDLLSFQSIHKKGYQVGNTHHVEVRHSPMVIIPLTLICKWSFNSAWWWPNLLTMDTNHFHIHDCWHCEYGILHLSKIIDIICGWTLIRMTESSHDIEGSI